MKALNLFIEPFLNRHGHTEIDRWSIHAYQSILGVEETLRAAIDWFREQRDKQRAIAELKGLSDSLLCDIDIRRSDIEAVVQERWIWLERPSRKAATKLSPVRVGKLEDLPAAASNDDRVRNLSTTLRHSPLQFTVQDLLSLDWVG